MGMTRLDLSHVDAGAFLGLQGPRPQEFLGLSLGPRHFDLPQVCKAMLLLLFFGPFPSISEIHELSLLRRQMQQCLLGRRFLHWEPEAQRQAN